MRSPLLRAASAACANRGLMPSATCKAVVPRGTCLALPSGSLMVMVSGINYSVYREEESVVSSQRRIGDNKKPRPLQILNAWATS